MANILKMEKQIAVISGLAEGMSIRGIERMTGVNQNTIMSLNLRVGHGCARVMDSLMRGLNCKAVQMDEIWGFVGKKQRKVTIDDSLEVGDVWTFIAVDADSKIVPCYRIGKRDLRTRPPLFLIWPRVSTIGFSFQVTHSKPIHRRLSGRLVVKLIMAS